jgi:hypothetical protein
MIGSTRQNSQQDMLGEGIGIFGKSRNERDTKRKREYSSPARFAARETDRSFRTPVRSNCFETNGRNGRDTRALNVPNIRGRTTRLITEIAHLSGAQTTRMGDAARGSSSKWALGAPEHRKPDHFQMKRRRNHRICPARRRLPARVKRGRYPAGNAGTPPS